jgi:hypothetical protein
MSSLAATERPEVPLFSDGVGERVVAADGATGELLQILRLRQSVTAVPSFEFALRERAARLANFRHAYYARVRRIDRGMPSSATLAIVSDHIEGTRLSDILRVANDINAALCLIRQLVPAVAVLHENARDVAHGLLAPERLIVTPNARLVIVEHVLGAAIEQLQFGRDRLWQEFRVAMPPSAGLPRFDHRADVTGMGLVALALILGRPLGQEEFPHHIPSLLNEARERSALGDEQPLSSPLRSWLERALQVDVRRAFASAPEALTVLEELVAEDSMYVAAPVALETFLSRYIASLLDPPTTLEAAPRVEPPVRLELPARSDAPVPTPIIEPHIAAAPPSRSDAVAPQVPVPVSVAELREVPVAPVAVVPYITELLGPDPLSAFAPAPVEARKPVEATKLKSLFDPDAPFVAPGPVHPQEDRARRPWGRISAIAAVLIALAGGGALALKSSRGVAAAPKMGALVVQSNPVGVPVFVDGVDRGRTPARVELPPGSHILELRGRGVPRVIPINVTPGSEVSQYLEFAETPVTGELAVQSEPAGAKVLVDGVQRGIAPMTIRGLAPGDHAVELQADGQSARHTVTVQSGSTASLMVPVGSAPAGPVSGWVTVRAPFSVEIREDGKLLGSTDTDRIMMAAGRHEIEIVNAELGYRATRVVQVTPGKVASITVDPPQGVINLNAAPWAEVWIDGKRVGETPIGNLSVAIGPHEIVFKHPQLGEKHHAVSVTLGAPVRVSVDMK